LKTSFIWTCLLCLFLVFFATLFFDFFTAQKPSGAAPSQIFNPISLTTSSQPIKKELEVTSPLVNLNEKKLQFLKHEPNIAQENEPMKAQIPAGAKTIESLILDAQNAKVKSEIDSVKSPFQSN